MKLFRKLCCLLLCVAVFAVSLSSLCFNVFAATGTGVVVGIDDNLRVRAQPNTTSNINFKLKNGATVEVLGEVDGATVDSSYGSKWYHIRYDGKEGYVYNQYLSVTYYNPDASFEQQLAQFPESYRDKLRVINAMYPNWVFQADSVSRSFWSIVDEESINQRKQVEKSFGQSWWSMDLGSYDWNTSEYIFYGNWTGAAKQVIAYYMDPRNFLNVNDIFMFLKQGYERNIENEAGVRRIVSGTFLNTEAYIGIIMRAADQTGVSPYFIASTIIQEQGSGGTSPLISGNYPGYEGYYNFFNVGASGSNVVVNGLTRAKNEGWNSPEASIIGGAKFYAGNYFEAGQDTYYYKDFDVHRRLGWLHQYAQSVYDACTKGRLMNKGNVYTENASQTLVFRIPVFPDLSDEEIVKPASCGAANNYFFKNIEVSGLTPTFSMYTYNYDLHISGNTHIKVTLPDGATLTGTTTYNLPAGTTRIALTVTAETKYATEYYINVQSDNNATVTISTENAPTEIIMRGDTNGDGKITVSDLANVQMHLIGVRTLTGNNLRGADTNNDGRITVSDLANIQMHLIGVKSLY